VLHVIYKGEQQAKGGLSQEQLGRGAKGGLSQE